MKDEENTTKQMTKSNNYSNNMSIIILCDQIDCIHNKRYYGKERIGSQGSNACIIQPGYLPITSYYNINEPAIRTTCLSKKIKIPE